MTRLVPKPEPIRRFTAFLEDGTQFEFDAKQRLAWSMAVVLAHGAVVKRIEARGPTWKYTEERR